MYLILEVETYDEWISGPDYAIVEITDELLHRIELWGQAYAAAKQIAPSLITVEFSDCSPEFFQNFEIEEGVYFSNTIERYGWSLLNERPPGIEEAINEYADEWPIDNRTIRFLERDSFTWVAWLKNSHIELETALVSLPKLLATIKAMEEHIARAGQNGG